MPAHLAMTMLDRLGQVASAAWRWRVLRSAGSVGDPSHFPARDALDSACIRDIDLLVASRDMRPSDPGEEPDNSGQRGSRASVLSWNPSPARPARICTVYTFFRGPPGRCHKCADNEQLPSRQGLESYGILGRRRGGGVMGDGGRPDSGLPVDFRAVHTGRWGGLDALETLYLYTRTCRPCRP